MPAKREPLIQWNDLARAFSAALLAAGIDPAEVATWQPVLAQTRISRLERGTSSSPERQLRDIVQWCVAWRFRPVLLLAEETSGSIYRKSRRVLLEQFYDDLVNERAVDPETGVPITGVVCWMYDRFTRDPDEGGMFIKAMLRSGIDLHESHWNNPPQALHQCQNQVRAALVRASQEVEQSRSRIIDELKRKAVLGIPTFGADGLFGHVRYLDPTTGVTAGYRADPLIQQVTDKIVHRFIDGASKYSIVCWLNENGYRNAAGRKWTMNNLERFLRAPRLAGLIRLRADARRIYEEGYQGDLYPIELQYEEGEEPDPDFDPPIEPLIPFPLWETLQEALDSRRRRRGPYVRRFASGRIRCSSCGATLRSNGASYVCRKHHLLGIVRDASTGGVAHDGLRHSTINIAAADMFLQELLFAVVEREFDPKRIEVSEDLKAKRDAIDNELAALNDDRENFVHLLAHRQIKRKQYDEWIAANEADTKALKKERQVFAAVDRLERLPRNMTLRTLWPGMTLETQREWLDIVFAEIVLQPATGGVLAVAERFKVTFQDGYAPPPEELRQLVAAIEAKVWEVCRKRPAHNRMPERVEDYAFALYQQGLDRSRMKRALESHADTDISGRDWANLRTVMKRICEERGVEYAPSRIDRSNLPYETRELMLDLYRQLRGWAVVGDELNRLGISRPGGGEWRSDSVRLTLLRHAEHQGLSLQKPKGAQRKGRPSHLSGAMRQRLWEMHYDEAMSYIAIARWLNERGIKTASGKAPWNKPTVMYTVQVVNRERKQLARKRAA